MDDAENSPSSGEEGLEPRGPSVEDLVELRAYPFGNVPSFMAHEG